MKLSVLMSVHNNAQTLQSALNSILTQTFKNFVFIIIDDASTDESSTILAQIALDDKRVKLITNKHRLGLTRSLNKGLKVIKTKYIARMDADDICMPKRFQMQLDFLDNHPNISLVGTAAYLINHHGKQLGLKRFPSDNQHLKNTVLRLCPFIHPTWMFRRLVLSQIGKYNQKFTYAQDYDFILRLLACHQAANLPQPLLKYRVDSPATISQKKLKQQELFALKARFMALAYYGYPVAESWKLIKPVLSFIVPAFIKKSISL